MVVGVGRRVVAGAGEGAVSWHIQTSCANQAGAKQAPSSATRLSVVLIYSALCGGFAFPVFPGLPCRAAPANLAAVNGMCLDCTCTASAAAFVVDLDFAGALSNMQGHGEK